MADLYKVVPARGRARRRLLIGGLMGIDYVREYLPFLPHTVTLTAMYACVAVVMALFIWGFVRRYRAFTRGGTSLWAAVNGKALPGARASGGRCAT